MSSELEQFVNQFLKWSQQPFDQELKQEILSLSIEEKRKWFSTRLEFGTAGLRGQMGYGFSRMNALVIVQTTQGILQHLIGKHSLAELQERGVVVGHDHRYQSFDFAHLVTAVFLSKKVKVYFFREICHTPLVPFGLKKLKALCGIMITASHNPKQDNGYKLYGENGCQIIPPNDSEIAALIEKNLEPWNEHVWDRKISNQLKETLCPDPSYQLLQEYYRDIITSLHLQNSIHDESPKRGNIKVCYTAMHGVGLPFAERMVETLGLPKMIIVEAQAKPDPEFPTVSFPNPEEKGSLNLAMQVAKENQCNVVFANDPDADRFAVAEFNPLLNKWTQFTGNQLGIILASFVCDQYRDDTAKLSRDVACITTSVSSHMLESFCKSEGIQFAETLTGFKWLGNKALEMESNGKTKVVFAFEEAIGFMCGTTVYDKDGISALGLFYEKANQLYGKGTTIQSYLESLYQKYGAWVSHNSYITCVDPILTKKLFDKIRYGSDVKDVDETVPRATHTLCYPKTLGGVNVVNIRDLTIGYDSMYPPHYLPLLPVSSSSQMLTFRLENECLITLRTSGTEPKIKYYTEFKGPDGINVQEAQIILDGFVVKVIEELLQPSLNGLK